MSDENLTRVALHAAKWSYSSTLITAALQVVVTAVLARLLAPSFFGLFAMAGIVLRFGQYFAQMGIMQALVQRPSLNVEHERAGFWASVLLGLAFAGIVWVLAPFAGTAFRSVGLPSVIRVMSLTFLVSGSSSAAAGVLRRRMRFKELAISDIFAYTLGYAGVGILMACFGCGIWSLVGASLAQGISGSLAYNYYARLNMRPIFSWAPYREILGFGTTISLISFLEFVDGNLDNIIVGRLSGDSALGYYSRAMSLTGIPMQYMSTSLSSVLLPSFSRVQDEKRRLGDAYISVITLFAGMGLPVAFGMSAAARDVVGVLLGPGWGASVVVMRFAAVAAVMSMLSHFSGIMLEATAHLREKLIMRAGQLVVFTALLVCMSPLGIGGYAAAFVLSEGLLYGAMSLTINRVFRVSLKELGKAHLPGLASGIAVGLALLAESWCGHRLGLSAFILLACEILSAGVIASFVGFRTDGGRLYDVLSERLTDAHVGIPRPVMRVMRAMAGRDQ